MPYYHRLSRRKQALYRRSVALAPPRFSDPEALRSLASPVQSALASGDGRRTRAKAQALLDAMCDQLSADPVKLRVRARRPSSEAEELQGLYEIEEGETPEITVWMRTSAQDRVVKFRTFMRILLHEFVHHLDYVHYRLEDSLHTEGFFKRESALMAAVAPKNAAPVSDAGDSLVSSPEPAGQLSLF